MVLLSSSYCSMVGLFALLGCCLLSYIENGTVQALSSNELYERDLGRLSKLRMEKRLDANNRLRPRASVLPPPPVFSRSFPDAFPYATCPMIVGLDSFLYGASRAAIIDTGGQIYCQYPNFDGIQPQCIYDTVTGFALQNIDGPSGSLTICGFLEPPTASTEYWGTCQATGASVASLAATTNGLAYCDVVDPQGGPIVTCVFDDGVLDETLTLTPDAVKCKAYDVQVFLKLGPILLLP